MPPSSRPGRPTVAAAAMRRPRPGAQAPPLTPLLSASSAPLVPLREEARCRCCQEEGHPASAPACRTPLPQRPQTQRITRWGGAAEGGKARIRRTFTLPPLSPSTRPPADAAPRPWLTAPGPFRPLLPLQVYYASVQSALYVLCYHLRTMMTSGAAADGGRLAAAARQLVRGGLMQCTQQGGPPLPPKGTI